MYESVRLLRKTNKAMSNGEPKRGSKLTRLSNAAVFDDGDTVAFTVETEDGEPFAVNCPLLELGDIFNFLGLLAKGAAEMKSANPVTPQTYLSPITASGIGFAAGRTPDETLLVMRLFGFDMAFAVPSSELERLADDIARIARTLSAGSGKPH